MLLHRRERLDAAGDPRRELALAPCAVSSWTMRYIAAAPWNCTSRSAGCERIALTIALTPPARTALRLRSVLPLEIEPRAEQQCACTFGSAGSASTQWRRVQRIISRTIGSSAHTSASRPSLSLNAR